MPHALVLPALLQTAIASADSGPSLGEWITRLVGAVALVAGTYRLGMNTADTRNIKTAITEALTTMNKKLDEMAAHIDTNQNDRVADANWKGDINSRLSTVEREMGEVRENTSKAHVTASEARAIAEATDRRTGPAERRAS